MAKSNFEELLQASGATNQSRSEVLQQLVIESMPGRAALQDGASGSSGGASSLESPLKDATNQISALTEQTTGLASAQQTQISVLQDNTQALTQNTSAKGSGSSVGGTVEGIASSLLGGGVGLSPILSGLMSLFGAGSSEVPAAPLPFRLPNPVQYDAGISGGQVVPVSYGETGQARTQTASPSPQVTVQVNAIDSQSFLDHSEEIAQAVKQAILSSSSLNDVIADL